MQTYAYLVPLTSMNLRRYNSVWDCPTTEMMSPDKMGSCLHFREKTDYCAVLTGAGSAHACKLIQSDSRELLSK